MTEKISITTICDPQAQDQVVVGEGVDVIWPSSDFHENCLPVIGSCQVSSILSTFEEPEAPEVTEGPEVTETKHNFKSIPINLINGVTAEDPKTKRKPPNEIFKQFIYFGCNLCPVICTKDSKITDHIQTVHKNAKNNNKKPQLKCPGCANIFYHKLSLKSHLVYDHEVGRGDINKIVNSIVYVSVLQDHETVINNNKEYEDLDDFIEAEDDKIESEDEKAKEEIDKQEEIECMVTETVVEGPETPETKTKKKHLKCYVSTCAVRMTELSNMSYHVKSHSGKIFRCLECGTNFMTWKTLQTHLWRSHNLDMELYSCDKCNYKTYSLAKLNNIHKLIHGNEKSFLCDFCGKGFKNPKQLRNHKIIHQTKLTNKLRVKCDICKSTFNDKRILKIHVQTVHEKLRPFACNYCSYKAASKGDLTLHVRVHTGHKPFRCDQCEYSTADHNSLRKHKSRHTNEKKYKCAHCEYACIQSSTYKTHLKTKHPGLENEHIFACDLCQFRSVNQNKYLNHLAGHKNEKSEVSAVPTPTPAVAVISKLDNCIILPVESNLEAGNLQYFYNASDVVLEIIDEKQQSGAS